MDSQHTCHTVLSLLQLSGIYSYWLTYWCKHHSSDSLRGETKKRPQLTTLNEMINTNAIRSYTLNNPVWEQLPSVPSCFIKMPMSFKSNDPHFVMHKLDSSDRCNTTVVTFQASTITSIQQICNTICIYIVMTKWGLELPTETRQREKKPGWFITSEMEWQVASLLGQVCCPVVSHCPLRARSGSPFCSPTGHCYAPSSWGATAMNWDLKHPCLKDMCACVYSCEPWGHFRLLSTQPPLRVTPANNSLIAE